MKFEAAIAGTGAEAYPACVQGEELDWRPAIEALVTDVERCVEPGDIARRFHNTLVEWIVVVAKQVGLQRVVLCGGCFQNSYLVERAVERLTGRLREEMERSPVAVETARRLLGRAVPRPAARPWSWGDVAAAGKEDEPPAQSPPPVDEGEPK